MTKKVRADGRDEGGDTRQTSTQPAVPSRFDVRQMIDHLTTPILMADAIGRVQYVNPAFITLFELPHPTKLIGQSVARIVDVIQHHFAAPEAFAARMQALLGTPQPTDHEERLLRSGDAIELEYEPVYAPDTGEFTGALWVFYDVTARRESQIAAYQAIDRYRAIVETIEDGYYEVDRRGTFTFVNDGLARLTDLSREALSGESYATLAAPETIPHVRRTFNEVWETGQPVKALEITVVRRDGRRRVAELSVGLVRDEQGQPFGFRGIVRDITERKQAEADLERRMTLLSVLQQVNADLNRTLDKETLLRVAVSAAAVLAGAEVGCIGLLEGSRLRVVSTIGYPPEALPPDSLLPVSVGLTGRALRLRETQLALDLAADPDYLELMPGMQAAVAIPLTSHEIVIGALLLEAHDPRVFTPEVVDTLEVLTARIVAAWDNAHLYDIARKQLDELRTLNAQLTALEQLKTDMIHIASHNMRNPLGIIAGYLGLLRDDLEDVLTPEQRGYFESINRALQRITRMTSDILSMEAVQRRIQTPPRERIDLRTMVRQTVEDIEREAHRRLLALNVSLPSAPVIVRADPANLPEAVINLLTNAIKYTPEGGRIDVRVRLAHSGRRALFEVEDTGYGIPPELQERLFQPFYRAKSDSTAHIEGTGLGLFLVKKIIEQHDGAMVFRSSYGVGSVFGFELPVAPDTVSETPEEVR